MKNLSFLETIDQKRKRKKSSDESSIVAMKKSPRQDGCKFSTFLNFKSVNILEILYEINLNNLHGVMVVWWWSEALLVSYLKLLWKKIVGDG